MKTIEVEAHEDGGDVFAAYLEDPDDYARRYAGFTRAFASKALRKYMFAPSARSKDDIDRLEAEFFKRMEALYRAKTNTYAFEQWHLKVILRRM